MFCFKIQLSISSTYSSASTDRKPLKIAESTCLRLWTCDRELSRPNVSAIQRFFIKRPLKLTKYSMSYQNRKTPYCQNIRIGFVKRPHVAFIKLLIFLTRLRNKESSLLYRFHAITLNIFSHNTIQICFNGEVALISSLIYKKPMLITEWKAKCANIWLMFGIRKGNYLFSKQPFIIRTKPQHSFPRKVQKSLSVASCSITDKIEP